jgi:hypothetical protein
VKTADIVARGAEQDRGLGFVEAEQVDRRASISAGATVTA